MIGKNLRAFYKGIELHWQPIAVAADFDEANKIINRLQRRRHELLPEVMNEKLRRILRRHVHAELNTQKPGPFRSSS